ncbi:MAG: gluconate:H+ symporter [Bacteroidia bacterium]|nr:gluconate:H+ symporter [Bacteroidia bacterium]
MLFILMTSLACLLALILLARLEAFLALLLTALLAGVMLQLSPEALTGAFTAGTASAMGSVLLILTLGAMLGSLVAGSGGAQQITDWLVGIFGIRYVQVALVITGFMVGIPMFYNVGFVVLVPLVFALAGTTRLPTLYLAVPMLAALSVTHGYLPPHPSPVAIANDFKADMGITLLYGLMVAIPAVLVGGLWFGSRMKGYVVQPPPDLYKPVVIPASQLPSVGVSLLCALLPVGLIAGSSLWIGLGGSVMAVTTLAGDPVFALMAALLLAVFLLRRKRGWTVPEAMSQAMTGAKAIMPIVLIIASAGVLKQILDVGEVDTYLANQLAHTGLSPLLLGWLMAAVIRVALGSATVAGLTTSGMLAGFVATAGVQPELMVLSVGAGSLMFSHVNDSGFWMFKEYFGLSVRDTLATWSVMETIVSVVGLLGVLALDLII